MSILSHVTMVQYGLIFLVLVVLVHATEARPRLNLGEKFKFIKESEIPVADAESLDVSR